MSPVSEVYMFVFLESEQFISYHLCNWFKQYFIFSIVQQFRTILSTFDCPSGSWACEEELCRKSWLARGITPIAHYISGP